jgi:hypothetical protein
MTIGQKGIALAHSAVFVSVCLLMLTSIGCPGDDTSQPPVIPPADRSVTLCFEYGSQTGYDAFPLGKEHVRLSYYPANVSLSIYDNGMYVSPGGLLNEDFEIARYVRDHTIRGQDSSQFMYKRHLLSIQHLLYTYQGVQYVDSIHMGMTNWGGSLGQEIVSFVCVQAIIDRFNYYNKNEAISGTTVHELYHNATFDRVACNYYTPNPHSPGGGCVMMDLAESAGSLLRWCYNTSFDYTSDFCELCRNKLKGAKSSFGEP